MSEKHVSDCKRCLLFRPHDAYEYLGLCIHKNELIVLKPDMKACKDFKEFTLDELKKVLIEKGWLRCISCKKPIHTVEELGEHIEEMLRLELHSDVVASEESPAAD